MGRLEVFAPAQADGRARDIADAAISRMRAHGNSGCLLEAAAGFFAMCSAQSCGKCTPCRIGLRRLSDDLRSVLEGERIEGISQRIREICTALSQSADCAIGFQAGRVGLAYADLVSDDALSHIERGVCAQPPTSVPCVRECPSHVDIPAYIACVKEGRYADAVRIIRNDNPFPSACAFVCEHPCEGACRRGMVDAPINIRAIKQHAVLEAGEVALPPAALPTGKKVAIVGGGPSGLTCAYYLALMGHSVTVYEQNDKLGGMMRYGIPRYRLPEHDLDYDIDAILSLGVSVKTGVKVGVGVQWDELINAFDCVYLAIGAHHFRDLGVEYATREGVLSAVQFLHRVADGRGEDLSGKDVVVVGGGNVAMDATRTAKRLGARSVRCIYRRRIEDMTALPEEVEAAIAEGCEMVELMSPVRVDRGSQHPIAFVGQPQMPSSYRAGRPAPVATSANEVAFECDMLIEAIGQVVEYGYFADMGLAQNRGKLIADEYGRAKGCESVFVGGDCQTGPSTVIRAIAAGKAVAANIDRQLGFEHDVHDLVDVPQPAFSDEMPCGRVNIQERPAAERVGDLNGVEVPLRSEEASQECGRCLRCDCFGMGAMREGRPRKW